jgi:hypothetical protein
MITSNKTPKVPSIYDLSADDIWLIAEMMLRLRKIGLINSNQAYEYLDTYYTLELINPEGTVW